MTNIAMVRPNLRDFPDPRVPAPFSIRAYQLGDETHWTRIERESDPHLEIRDELYRRQFGHDEEALRKRQFFLCDADGIAVGTATAWHNADYPDAHYGRVHWVAVVPPLQGRGLGKVLLGACLGRIRKLGYRGAYLTTEPVRIPAIHLYLRFGFVPDIRSADQRDAWQGVLASIRSEFRPILRAAIERPR